MSPPVPRSFIVPAGADRHDSAWNIGPDTAHRKVSSDDTDGAFALFEYAGRAEGGPPLHLHLDQDEIFIVQDGTYLFQCGQDRSTLATGDTIFLPRGIPHAFKQVSPSGRLWFMFTPAGNMEAFFCALAACDGPPAPHEGAALFAAHGMEVVGPPIAAD